MSERRAEKAGTQANGAGEHAADTVTLEKQFLASTVAGWVPHAPPDNDWVSAPLDLAKQGPRFASKVRISISDEGGEMRRTDSDRAPGPAEGDGGGDPVVAKGHSKRQTDE